MKFTSSGSVSVEAKSKKAQGNSEAAIQITNNQEPTTITFEVKDTGVGMAADELEKLFQPFVQTASGQKVQQGTGLGLTISRQFVPLMEVKSPLSVAAKLSPLECLSRNF